MRNAQQRILSGADEGDKKDGRSLTARTFEYRVIRQSGVVTRNEVIDIRNVTKDAVALGACKIPSTDDILSQIKSDSCLNKERVFVSKKEWAGYLGICEMTIIRWEKNIIAKSRFFRVSYWDMKGNPEKINRFNSGQSIGYRLDYFQRFILTLIRVIKAGGFSDGRIMKYDHEVVRWLNETHTGQDIKRFFDRDTFKQSINNNQQRKSA